MVQRPHASQAVGHDRCPACGAAVESGLEGCQALWDTLAARGLSDWRYAAVRDLAFDAYCMQHPERYCRSAKSYAAHLTRLCCGLEHGGSPTIYAAIQRWLNGAVPLEKPPPLAHAGSMTVADVYTARTPDEYATHVRAWAEAVWAAYAPHQAQARAWLRAALGDDAGSPAPPTAAY